MLERKNCRYNNELLLIKEKLYFKGLLVIKNLFEYPDGENLKFAIKKVYLFGVILVWKHSVSMQEIIAMRMKGLSRKPNEYSLDCSHYMLQNMAKDINEDREIISKLRSLCEGLDSKSIECVNRIVARLKISYLCKDKKFYDLTKQELDELTKINQEFYSNIILFGGGGGAVFFYNGYFLPINGFEVSVFWHKHSLEVLETLDKIAKKDIVDVGGYIGDSAVLLQEYTECNIYSFEAISSNYQLMLETIKLNNAQKVIPIKKALGCKNEKVKIYNNASGSTMAFELEGRNFEEVEVITLDDFVRENRLEIGFIKVDIEGFEMEFLKGALETIKTQKPTMLISIYHQASDFFGIKPFLESLNLGYTFKIHKPIDWSVSGETVLFCEVL